MNGEDLVMRRRIETLIDSFKGDRTRSQQLFQYIWAMVCVRRGLLRVVREVPGNGSAQLLLEEVKTGRQRLIPRPAGLDDEVEGLAVQAFARILSNGRGWV